MNDFNVLAIQNNLSELANTLKDMQDVKDFVFIDGCVSKLMLGTKEVPVQFDKMLYSCDKNILILVMKDSQLNTSDIEEVMHEKNIHFSKYVCDGENNNYKNNLEVKEVSFVSEKDTFKKAIVDSKEKGNDNCVYYPNVSGKLELGYLTNEGRYGLFLRMMVDGVVDFNDKMILFLKKEKIANISDREIFDFLMDAPVKILVDTNVNVQTPRRMKTFFK